MFWVPTSAASPSQEMAPVVIPLSAAIVSSATCTVCSSAFWARSLAVFVMPTMLMVTTAARMPRIEMTTSISISVNPRWLLFLGSLRRRLLPLRVNVAPPSPDLVRSIGVGRLRVGSAPSWPERQVGAPAGQHPDPDQGRHPRQHRDHHQQELGAPPGRGEPPPPARRPEQVDLRGAGQRAGVPHRAVLMASPRLAR